MIIKANDSPESASAGQSHLPGGVTLVTPGTQEVYVFDTATYKVFGVAVFVVV